MSRTIFLLLLCGAAFRTSAQISFLNGSFEQWHSVNGLYEDPDGWLTNNTINAVRVEKDTTTPFHGNCTLRLLDSGIARTPVFPTGTFGYLFTLQTRISISGTDSVHMLWIQHKPNQQKDSVWRTFYPSTGWQSYTFFNSAQPSWSFSDSTEVLLIGGRNVGTIADFDLASAIMESVDDKVNGKKVLCYPVPAGVSAVVQFSNPGQEDFSFGLRDSQGVLVRLQTGICGESITVPRSGLQPGCYFWLLTGEKSRQRAGGKIQFY